MRDFYRGFNEANLETLKIQKWLQRQEVQRRETRSYMKERQGMGELHQLSTFERDVKLLLSNHLQDDRRVESRR